MEFIEPILVKANDKNILINGKSLPVPFRVISEDNYQIIKRVYDLHPELLEALQFAFMILERDKDPIFSKRLAISKAKEAIEKALK